MGKLIFIFTLFFVTFSCRHATVIPDDAARVKFSKVQSILISNCTGTCHEHTGGGNRSFTIKGNDTILDTNKLKKYIQPGSPDKSQIYSSITSLVSPMPPKSPMPEGNIILIYTWIKEGAKYSD